MSSQYYIDGYNVIHKCPRLRKLAHGNFETARDTLIEEVSRFCFTTGNNATIVFDGARRAHQPEPDPPVMPGVEVLYSPGHLSADTVIERRVYQARGDLKEIIVVSGDMGIRDLCASMGTLVMAAENFLRMVEDTLSRSRAIMKGESERYTRSNLGDRLSDDSRKTLDVWKKRLED